MRGAARAVQADNVPEHSIQAVYGCVVGADHSSCHGGEHTARRTKGTERGCLDAIVIYLDNYHWSNKRVLRSLFYYYDHHAKRKRSGWGDLN